MLNAAAIRERLHDRRFWIVQALMGAVAAVHVAFENVGTVDGLGDLYLLPVSLFIFPVLYASLTFGLEGILATALWCTLLLVDPLIQFHTSGQRVAIILQLAFVVLLGTIVAVRVDTERQARLAAEESNRQLANIQASLKNYIGLALRASEAERSRLSRGLHDETVQELVVAKTALEVVHASHSQRAQLDLVDAALQRCIDGIRRLCRALRPSVLDDLGLVPALDWLLTDLSGRTEIQTALEAHCERPLLSPEQELVIFRVAQEALHNIERHAHAGRVVVGLSCDAGRVHLKVSDDGCGFDPSHARQGGLGLTGMRERAGLIGAELEVSSSPGATCVRLSLGPTAGPAAQNGGRCQCGEAGCHEPDTWVCVARSLHLALSRA